jgi:hypothetical protein
MLEIDVGRAEPDVPLGVAETDRRRIRTVVAEVREIYAIRQETV